MEISVYEFLIIYENLLLLFYCWFNMTCLITGACEILQIISNRRLPRAVKAVNEIDPFQWAKNDRLIIGIAGDAL